MGHNGKLVAGMLNLTIITRYFDCSYVPLYHDDFELYDYVQHKDNFHPEHFENIVKTYHVDIVLFVKTSR